MLNRSRAVEVLFEQLLVKWGDLTDCRHRGVDTCPRLSDPVHRPPSRAASRRCVRQPPAHKQLKGQRSVHHEPLQKQGEREVEFTCECSPGRHVLGDLTQHGTAFEAWRVVAWRGVAWLRRGSGVGVPWSYEPCPKQAEAARLAPGDKQNPPSSTPLTIAPPSYTVSCTACLLYLYK